MATDETGDETRVAYIQALEQALRPLVPLALNYGVTYPDLMEMVRNLYITALADRLTKEGRPATAARMGIMTGLNRGEIEKLHFGKGASEKGAANVSTLQDLAILLAVWHDDNRFSSPYGAPLDLSLQNESGFRSLEELIEAARPEMDRDLVLDGLVASGNAEIHEDKFIRCTNRTLVPAGVMASQISRMGDTVGYFCSTIARNIADEHTDDEPAYFESTTTSDYPMSSKGRDAVLSRAREDGKQYLEALDKWVAEMESEFSDPAGQRYGVGVFFYESGRAGDLSAVLPKVIDLAERDSLRGNFAESRSGPKHFEN